MATVGELAAPYENHLRRVLPEGEGVCLICHTSIVGTYTHCWQCNRHRELLSMRADVVGFVALAVEREQFARELWVYKDGRENVRRRPQFGLAAVPWRWLALHEGCLALAAGAERFDLVTTVPSTKQRVDHPLTEIVRTLVGPTRERYRELLQPRDPTDNSREAADDRFICEAELEGEPVLVVDDTWTTGAHAQSAACSLRRSGSGPVAVLALGRRFALSGAEEHREAAQRYLTRAPIGSFRWEQCCLCGR